MAMNNLDRNDALKFLLLQGGLNMLNNGLTSQPNNGFGRSLSSGVQGLSDASRNIADYDRYLDELATRERANQLKEKQLELYNKRLEADALQRQREAKVYADEQIAIQKLLEGNPYLAPYVLAGKAGQDLLRMENDQKKLEMELDQPRKGNYAFHDYQTTDAQGNVTNIPLMYDKDTGEWDLFSNMHEILGGVSGDIDSKGSNRVDTGIKTPEVINTLPMALPGAVELVYDVGDVIDLQGNKYEGQSTITDKWGKPDSYRVGDNTIEGRLSPNGKYIQVMRKMPAQINLSDQIVSSIDKLLNEDINLIQDSGNALTGSWNELWSRVPGSEESTYNDRLQEIKDNIATELSERNRGQGSLSDKDVDRLRNALGILRVSTSKPEIIRKLSDIRDIFSNTASKNRPSKKVTFVPDGKGGYMPK